jgi:hypothetical protein
MKCKVCGKNADSEYCFAHKSRKPLPLSGKGLNTRMSSISYNKAKNVHNDGHIIQRTSSKLSKQIEKKLKTAEMFEFFISYWKKSDKKSAVSGKFLGKEPLSVFFHHILPKEKYPEACLDEENIILLTLEEHSNVENDMYRYEEVNKRRNYLLTKYERT